MLLLAPNLAGMFLRADTKI